MNSPKTNNKTHKQKNPLQPLVDQINRMNDADGIDIIDGVRVRDVVADVMLDVAFSPVIPTPIQDNHIFDPPRPADVIQLGNGMYGIVHGVGEQADYETVTTDALKLMRARYLLLRDHFYKRLGGMDRVTRRMVLDRFFPGGVWVPREIPITGGER